MKDRIAPAPATAETVEVRLMLEQGAVRRVHVRDGARARAAAVLKGRDAAGAPGLARRLFPVCGLAHEAALTRALTAAGADLPEPPQAARQVLTEAAASHVWRVCIDWPAALGLPPRPAPVRRARAALGAFVAGDADGGRAELSDLLSDPGLFGDGPGSIAHRLLAALGPLADLALDSAAPEGAALLSAAPRDPLPVPQGARLADRIAAILARVRATRAALTGAAPVPPVAARADAHGATAIAQTARGPLVYRVTFADGAVAGLDMAAPTDLILAPGGALVRGLGRIAGGDTAARARALVAAFDPCGEVRLTIDEAAHA